MGQVSRALRLQQLGNEDGGMSTQGLATRVSTKALGLFQMSPVEEGRLLLPAGRKKTRTRAVTKLQSKRGDVTDALREEMLVVACACSRLLGTAKLEHKPSSFQ